MKRAICKFIVYLFIIIIICGIYIICLSANKYATLMVLAMIGMFSIGGFVVKIIDWLFEDKSEVADSE